MVFAQAEKKTRLNKQTNKQIRKQGHFTYTTVSTDVVLGDNTCAQEQRAVPTQKLVKKKNKNKKTKKQNKKTVINK